MLIFQTKMARIYTVQWKSHNRLVYQQGTGWTAGQNSGVKFVTRGATWICWPNFVLKLKLSIILFACSDPKEEVGVVIWTLWRYELR